jgi:UDPglucose--hexose-1-phosphate uridylyltransferase
LGDNGPPMELKREVLTSDILDPRSDFQPTPTEVEVRWDPLLGYSARLVTGSRLLPPSDFDLEAFGRKTAETCFFCAPRVEAVTPKFPAALVPEGRIRRGEALLFPNIQAYSRYSSVSVYSPALHYLPLDRVTGPIVRDNLAAQVDFVARCIRYDPSAPWVSINANHMLPSGSSLFHPHMQGSVDPHPTTMQEQLGRVPSERFEDYLATERRLGERHLGTLGGVEWLASFAPLGFNELRAFVPGVRSPEELDEERLDALAEGIARALNLYADLGYQSFNLAIAGAPAEGHVLSARLVCRSNLQELYRSDVAYFERLHWQAMVDGSPEALAEQAGDRFRS